MIGRLTVTPRAETYTPECGASTYPGVVGLGELQEPRLGTPRGRGRGSGTRGSSKHTAGRVAPNQARTGPKQQAPTRGARRGSASVRTQPPALRAYARKCSAATARGGGGLRRFTEYHDLEGAFGRRAVTERAKGILMERHAVDESAAFEMLRDRSRAASRKLVDTASAVVDGHPLLPKQAPEPAD